MTLAYFICVKKDKVPEEDDRFQRVVDTTNEDIEVAPGQKKRGGSLKAGRPRKGSNMKRNLKNPMNLNQGY